MTLSKAGQHSGRGLSWARWLVGIDAFHGGLG